MRRAAAIVGQSVATMVVLLVILISQLGRSGPVADSSSTPTISTLVASALDPDPGHGAARIARVSRDTRGDVTVVFVLRDAGTVEASHAAALADVLAIFRAIYESPAQQWPASVTLVGKSASTGSGELPERPVLYASLTTERAMGRDWAQLTPTDVERAVPVRWMPSNR